MKKMFAIGHVYPIQGRYRINVTEYIEKGKIKCEIRHIDMIPDYPYLGEGETSFLSAGEAWQYINGKVLT